MLRSMFAGVSGLRSHQTMMDVVGNNISNVNTSGFKASRATFQDALYQVVRGSTGGVLDEAGGVNPMQVGLGSRVASIDGVFGQGALQLTGRSTDVAIQGEGYFMVDGPAGPLYTRAGTFSFDSVGNLVAPGGEIVQGFMPDGGGAIDPTGAPANISIAGITDYRDIAVGSDGTVVGRDDTGAEVVLAQLALATFANDNGLQRVGNSLFGETVNSGAAQTGAAMTDARGSVSGGALEMSNVDLAQEFTGLIMAQRGFQANARTITTSDELLQELVNIKR